MLTAHNSQIFLLLTNGFNPDSKFDLNSETRYVRLAPRNAGTP